MENSPATKVRIKSGVTIDTTATVHQGTISKVIHNKGTGFVIIVVGGVTCLGVMPETKIGMSCKMKGSFTEDKKYQTWQFKFTECEASFDSARGMRELLERESPLNKNQALKVMHAFGDGVFEVIEKEPHRLVGTAGITIQKAEELVAWLKAEQSNAKIKKDLYNIGLMPAQVAKVIAKYGHYAEKKIREDCFSLTEIVGFGFKTVAAIADLVGVPKDDPGRIRAAFRYALDTLNDEGHVCILGLDLIRETCELTALAQDKITPYLAGLIKDGGFLNETSDWREVARAKYGDLEFMKHFST